MSGTAIIIQFITVSSMCLGRFFVMATRKMHALVQVHLTTANQSEIRKAYHVSVVKMMERGDAYEIFI